MSATASTPVLVISGADVRRLLPMQDCIPLIERAMREVSRGKAQLPLRIGCMPSGTRNILAVMPGCLDEPPSIGAKVIAVYPGNAQRGVSSHRGVVVLFDSHSGLPLAVLDAASITGLRTAAASAVATNALASEAAADLTIIGTGEQAAAHLHAISLVRKLGSIRVWGRSKEKAYAFADREAQPGLPRIEVYATIRDALLGADIVARRPAHMSPSLKARGSHRVRT